MARHSRRCRRVQHRPREAGHHGLFRRRTPGRHDDDALRQQAAPTPPTPDATDAASAKPAFAILLYPVIDLTDDAITHKGSRSNLTQDNPALYEALSPQKHVTRDTPPVFLVQGTNDRTVPVTNSILFYEACVKAGVPAEMHILEKRPHGFGMGLTRNDEVLKAWPDQASAGWAGINGCRKGGSSRTAKTTPHSMEFCQYSP